jgi:hypothetical protein
MKSASLFALCLVTALCASACAGTILVVDLSHADVPTQMLVASVQGVVNRDPCAVGVYAVREPQDAAWLSLYRGEVERVTPDQLLARVRDRLAGQVLYDPAEAHSFNLAAAAAAILDAALTPNDLGLKTVLDARGRWPDRLSAYRYAVAQVMRESAPDRLALVGGERADVRDYLTRERVLAVDLDWRDPEQEALLREILSRLQPGSLVLGSPEMVGDDALLALLAQNGHLLVPISRASNLSFHSAHPVTAPLHQLERVAPPALQVLVTFVYEGGADVGFALGRMRELWADPARGRVPLGWTISPALLELAPAVMQSYCAGAWLSGTDELVLAPNGAGYFVPTRHPNWAGILERMAKWARAGDFRVAAIADRGPASELRQALPHYWAAGMRGLVLGAGAGLTTGIYDGLPVAAQALRATAADAALRDIREASRAAKYIYVSVDPWSLTPSDLAYIARRLGSDYLVLRPREFMAVAREASATGSRPPRAGNADIASVALRPAEPGPRDEVEVRATVRSPVELDSVQAVYAVSGAPGEWSARLQREPDDRYTGALPPLLGGGPLSVRLRAVDRENGITWSAPVSLTIAAPDADDDGLSDALESLVRTDPAAPDTDGDGWRDGNDSHPLLPDRFTAFYLWPVAPPGDGVYLAQGGGSVSGGIRAVEGDQTAVYKLPLASAPAGSRPVLHAVVGGDYRLEVSADGREWREIASASGDAPLAPGAWEITAAESAGETLWVRLSDRTPQGEAPARLAQLSLRSHPDGPSILPRGTDPTFPGPGMPMTAAAAIFAPGGIAEARLYYRINDAGTIAVPMLERGHSQVYGAQVRGALNGDVITYWVAATDGQGNAAATRPLAFHVGVIARETISLLAGRDFEGEWEAGAEWDGSRWNPQAGAADRATVNLSGGAYRWWVLAAPREGGVRVSVDGRELGAANAAQPDGWQSLGTRELPRGRHEVVVTSTDDVRSGYAQVLITQDRSLVPPSGLVCDFYNSLTVLAPMPGQKVKGLVEIEATGTGNIGAVECYVDGRLVDRGRRPPYRFRWNARRAAAGPHPVELRALNHAGELLLTTSMQLELGR